MLPTRLLMNTAKKAPTTKVPLELTPLFIAVTVALCSGCYFTYRKLTTDGSLRLKVNSDQSALREVLNQDK